MANPAIKFYILPAPDAAMPAKAVLTAKESRLYFNLPSEAGPNGSRKEIAFKQHEKVPVYLSIFPDRGTAEKAVPHQDLVVELAFTDAKGQKESLSLPVYVINQKRDRPATFRISVDFSQDKTGFFQDERKRAVVVQVANDWAYYVDDMQLGPVAAGAEKTFIWNPDGFKTGRYVTNAKEYTGYLLYAYGIKSELLRSGGEPSQAGGYQTQKGKLLPIRRSGGLEVEIQGNYNQRGWLVELPDADWWKSSNLRHVENDLYSIVHHEIGHALFFNPANTRFAAAKAKGKLEDPALREYLGSDPKIDKSDHFDGTIDPVSRRGTFGYEYHGDMPRGRWLISKADLLCAQALGYKLREVSALAPLTLLSEKLPSGTVSAKYSKRLRAMGGIPFYHWELVSGALPDGLSLDSFTGQISGTPRKAGTFDFTVQVRDYDERASGKRQRLQIQICAE
jgi:hypothetical protein